MEMIKRLSKEFQSLIHSPDLKEAPSRIADFTQKGENEASKKSTNRPVKDSFELVDADSLRQIRKFRSLI